MFTGLVQQVGTLVAMRPGQQRQTLVVEARFPLRERETGASIAVDGVCLTVTSSSEDRLEFDAAFETLRLTTLGGRMIGDRLNLEPALRVGDPLGGHLCSGHVDGVGTVRSVLARGDAREVWIDVPGDLMRFVAPKGSICVDGTSLTVNGIDAVGLSVGLVPHTLQVTTLDGLAAGRRVNLEVDLVARYVARLLEYGRAPEPPPPPGLSVDALVEAGYLDPGDGRR
ncbi:riboflavin synthase [Paraliomyxa miuraensis]|uniref:riboflavin synthase n=1 Tax=Paraliomyxa miuraensis TaxID=376150 RepID=UPI00224FD3FA|nr:riboflavin synthase [Paraliomyxa miuraensis]MCX4244654.1 riboflavin synthase [Paraliomyxa miuraensis]